MATQQFGYGPNVWAPAKGIGVQQFAKLAQPGAVAPQFKENKYKALAAKAIGEMAYGAMMNSETKKQKAIEEKKAEELRVRDHNINSRENRFQYMMGGDEYQFKPSIVPTTKDETNTETNTSTETKTYSYPDDWNPLTSPKGPNFLGLDKAGVEGMWKYQDPVYPQGGYGEVKEGYWYHKPITSFSGYQDGSTVTIDGKTYTMIGS